MIKKYMIFSLLILALPLLCVKAKCSEAELERYRKELENLTFDLEYIPEGAEIENATGTYAIEETNLIKVTSPNMPKDYIAHFYKNNLDSKMVSSRFYSFLTGGVYSVRIQRTGCTLDEPVMEFTMMIPHYDTKYIKKNIWFDGTYSSSNSIYEHDKKIKIDIRLLTALISLILVVTALLVFLLKKRRRNII